eukprot:905401-Rhodomonas_salina.1
MGRRRAEVGLILREREWGGQVTYSGRSQYWDRCNSSRYAVRRERVWGDAYSTDWPSSTERLGMERAGDVPAGLPQLDHPPCQRAD